MAGQGGAEPEQGFTGARADEVTAASTSRNNARGRAAGPRAGRRSRLGAGRRGEVAGGLTNGRGVKAAGSGRRTTNGGDVRVAGEATGSRARRRNGSLGTGRVGGRGTGGAGGVGGDVRQWWSATGRVAAAGE
nr:uncharacterized PE-PGRS family protein PE_PGRS10-like [Aegilops tauschii subsp. strangulata]